jgi:L-fuconolactonase
VTATTIDTHGHAISLDQRAFPITPIGGGPQSAWSRDFPVPAEQLVTFMDEAGVDKTLLLQPATAYGYDNSYIAASVRQFPERFFGVFLLDILAPDARETLSYWVETQGLHGLWLYTPGGPDALAAEDPRAEPILKAAARLGLVFDINGHPRTLARIARIVQRFPEVRWQLDHLAYIEPATNPDQADVSALFELASVSNLFLKVSTRNLGSVTSETPQARDFFRRLIDAFGPERVMWGSNFTASHDRTYREMVYLARDVFSFLGPDDLDRVMGGTALSVWPALAR